MPDDEEEGIITGLFLFTIYYRKLKPHIRRKKCVITNTAIVKIALAILVDAQRKINANVNNYGD